MHQSYTTIIIGAGPGGLACAARLAAAGMDVLVLERNRTVGPKVCGGGITWSGLCNRVDAGVIDRSFPEQHIFSAHQSIVVRSPAPIISTVRRETLGNWMLQAAIRAGATVMNSTRALEIGADFVRTDRGRFSYRFLVGADGSGSLVRRYLRLPVERLGAGVHFLVPGDFPRMEWHLDHRLFENGYAWIFPYNGFASIGAYADRERLSPRLLLEALRNWAGVRGISFEGLQPRAGIINFDFRGWRFGNKFLVGDAAGLASGLTGEGMYPAIVSGEAAARAILLPASGQHGLERLLSKHRRHRLLLDTAGRSRTLNLMISESLLLALRSRLFSFTMLELTD